MRKCMSCGRSTMITVSFADTDLCKGCANLANVSAWNLREFVSMDALQSTKADTIQKANISKMNPDVINKISQYFNEYIDAGFVTSANGKAGQTLKIFENYCIIHTKSDSVKNELETLLHRFEDDDEDEIPSSNDKRNLVNGLMSGRIVQAGIGVVLSATLNQQEKEKAAERKSRERQKNIDRLIAVGDRRVDYRNISHVEYFCASGSSRGYLKFVYKGAAPSTLYDCEYFLFNNSIPVESRKIRQHFESVCTLLNDKLYAIEQASQAAKHDNSNSVENRSSHQGTTDVFDEIRKFKGLMDDGIISEEDFTAKKKQLLGL